MRNIVGLLMYFENNIISLFVKKKIYFQCGAYLNKGVGFLFFAISIGAAHFNYTWIILNGGLL